MKIKSMKANYELQAAPNLIICFKIDQDTAACEKRCLSFDPESKDYGIIGRLKIYDPSEIETMMEWEEKLDLSSDLSYAFLDEIIENAIWKRVKSLWNRRGYPGDVGNYLLDDPAVVWLTRKETFQRVVRGSAIGDRRTFSGEIVGENREGDVVRLLLKDDRNVQLYRNDELTKEGDIVLRPCTGEESDGNGKAAGQFEKIRFTDILDEIENHIKDRV